jgi:hypothetical protein
VRYARNGLLSHALADNWAQGKSGWKRLDGERVRAGDGGPARGLFDASVRSTALGNDEMEATLLEYGGRDHGKTIARLMSVAAKRSAGIDATSAPARVGQAGAAERVYTAPRSALDPLSGHAGPVGRRRDGGSSNPLSQRAGGRLRREQPRQAGSSKKRHGGRGADGGGQSPMSRYIKEPQSPESPVRGSHSPLAASASGSFSAACSPGGDGFAKGRSKVQGVSRARKKDQALSSMLGHGDSPLEVKPGVKFGEPVVSRGAERREGGRSVLPSVGSRRHATLDDSGSSDSVTEERTRNPLSPLLAARALTSPYLLPIKGRGGKKASAHGILPTGNMHHTWKKEDEDPNVYTGAQKQGWQEQVRAQSRIV